VTVRYECAFCGEGFDSDAVEYRCRGCSRTSGLLVRQRVSASRRPGIAVDPLSLLPIPIPHAPAYPVGNTPLAVCPRLREALGLPNLFLKLDNLNPSGSLKDRASLLVAEQALILGEKRVTLASTGNAGASMASAGAALSLEVILFVPAAAPRAKLLQALLAGARVVPIEGTYDEAFALSLQYTEARGGINRNTGYHPFTIEGKKTVSIEIYNQLGCEAPDAVYVPTGDGVILSGVAKGFADLEEAGLIARSPRLVAVQAEGSNAVARSWREGRTVSLERVSTIADSLSVATPACGELAVRALRRAGGHAVEVRDEEIRQAERELSRDAGVFVEPAAAAAFAGLRKDRASLSSQDRVVVLLTGTGFKDLAAAERLTEMPPACKPSLAEALRYLDRQPLGPVNPSG